MGVFFLSRHEGHDIERLATDMRNGDTCNLLPSLYPYKDVSGFATMSASRMGDTLVRCDSTRPGKLVVTLLLNEHNFFDLKRLPPVGLIAVTRATTICRPR